MRGAGDPPPARLWASLYGALLANATSVAGTTLVTAGLGYLYWTLAARRFPTEAVGLASAAISAMLLLGNAGMLGLGSLLVRELPRRAGHVRSLTSAALLVAGAAGLTAGLLFALVAPAVSAEFRPLAAGPAQAALFAAGVCATAVVLVLDQVLIGRLRGHLMFARNALFAVAKLGALFVAGLWLTSAGGLVVYAAWLAGNAVSLLAVLPLFAGQTGHGAWATYLPRWGLLRSLGRAALGHHALNLALQVPMLALPVLVTAQLSATINAYFYIAWMVVGFVYVIPSALTTAVYAVGAHDPQALAHKLRFSLLLSVVLATLAYGLLIPVAPLLLGFFGPAYAEQATPALRVLGLGVYPLIVRDHYVAVNRLHGSVARAARLVAAFGVLEFACAVAGGAAGGLTGLTAGWLLALSLQALVMIPAVFRAATAPPPSVERRVERDEPVAPARDAASQRELEAA